MTANFPYPPRLKQTLWPWIADHDWSPDELNEPLALQVQVRDRIVGFSEFVNYQNRVLSLAIWPCWVDQIWIFGIVAMMLDLAAPTVVRVVLTPEGSYAIWVAREDVPRLVTRNPHDMRQTVRDIVDGI